VHNAAAATAAAESYTLGLLANIHRVLVLPRIQAFQDEILDDRDSRSKTLCAQAVDQELASALPRRPD
jgi:hypothetical protein